MRARRQSTRSLASVPVVLRLAPRQRWLGVLLGALLVVASVAGVLGARAVAARATDAGAGVRAPQAALERLRRDNEGLAAELAMERATRRALDAQLAGLNAELAELRREREFLQAQRAPARRNAP